MLIIIVNALLFLEKLSHVAPPFGPLAIRALGFNCVDYQAFAETWDLLVVGVVVSIIEYCYDLFRYFVDFSFS